MTDLLERYCATLTATNAATIDDLLAFFTDDARFKDPFSDVRGKTKIRRVFEKTYEDLDHVRIVVTDVASGAHAHYIRWTFTCLPKGFLRRRGELVIEGMTELHVDGGERVTAHLDYWDPTPDLYQRVPILGAALGALRRQIGVR